MHDVVPNRRSRARSRPLFECIALLLQGGGALGAYQAGVYQALSEANLHPDWVAGISIGAINSAIIAGNPPEQRVAKLRAFWQGITANPLFDWAAAAGQFAPKGDVARGLFNNMSAAWALVAGAPNFFALRQPPAWLHPVGSLEATSFYETKLLKATLEQLVDFDRINSGEMRFSVGAVNVRTGNFVYFDNTTREIRPEHVMASGSLPPGFPAVEIEGEHYWDGGLISNTPLQWASRTASARTRSRSKSTSGARVASFPATSPRSRRGRRRSSTRAGRAQTRTSSGAIKDCAARSRLFWRSCPRI